MQVLTSNHTQAELSLQNNIVPGWYTAYDKSAWASLDAGAGEVALLNQSSGFINLQEEQDKLVSNLNMLLQTTQEGLHQAHGLCNTK